MIFILQLILITAEFYFNNYYTPRHNIMSTLFEFCVANVDNTIKKMGLITFPKLMSDSKLLSLSVVYNSYRYQLQSVNPRSKYSSAYLLDYTFRVMF